MQSHVLYTGVLVWHFGQCCTTCVDAILPKRALLLPGMTMHSVTHYLPVRNGFEDKGIDNLQCPGRSPKLNALKPLWDVMDGWLPVGQSLEPIHC